MNRTPSKTFTELIGGQKAHAFVLSAYKLTETFPKSETYGLSSQLRRAAVSIPANMAEGFKKRGPADKARFMNMAQGSPEEVQHYLILAHDLTCAVTTNLRSQLDEVSRLLEGQASAILASHS